jgi:hypothetical protein
MCVKNFLASVLKMELLNMMSSAAALEGSQSLKLHHEKEQLCCILASLMHKEVTTVHLPDFKFMWTKETGSKLKKLVQVIGAECPRLRFLDLKFSSPFALESRIGSALSRLVKCDPRSTAAQGEALSRQLSDGPPATPSSNPLMGSRRQRR